ncbi:GNAT family N-acetyltransferase [Roseisolibacter agri]|uniref:Acetyltransferase n=1 Tax=Roseisolibacter agri TaxID=2014610 RepID=A0AA37QC40_9BACT|nr:GNAT family N-acetyltransferase [Roseisolibacter agri]GLC23535.1 acetyltransferase [Roseisolibacter agri]
MRDTEPARLLPDADRLPTLDTPRLRLRWLTPDDAPALFAIFGDPAVCRYWSRPPLTDVPDAHALLAEIAASFAERSLFQWGIAERDGGRLVGTCTLASLSPEHARAEVGFALARACWGRGYVAEALPAMVRFAFETLGLHRLEADADPRNAASIRALERVGFVREGHQRERYWMSDEWQDAILFGLLRRDWRD